MPAIERQIEQYEKDRREAVRIISRLLIASGTTSPRVGGVGECTFHTIDDPKDIEDLCQKIEELSEIKKEWLFFRRDAEMLRDADSIIIITSLRSLRDPSDINCNMCGFITCETMKEQEKLSKKEDKVAFTGPLCTFRAANVAYALNGVVSLARELGVDFGIFWSAGFAAMEMKLVPKDTGFAVGVGLSVTEKSPFRDIPLDYDIYNTRNMQDRIINRLWPQFRSIYS